jgi:uncharacterized protein (DUF305 family)
MEMKQGTHQHAKAYHTGMYKKLAIMIVLSFIAMYILMYAMVDRLGNVIPNVNQFYMAGLMTAAMLVIELIIMGGMYKMKKLNIILLIAGFAAMVGFFLCIHQQAAVRDKQFLKSMIPHHAAAVLMVEKASLTDPEIKELANKIIISQQAEIAQMKAKLEALENK